MESRSGASPAAEAAPGGARLRYFDLPGLRMHAAEAGPADGPLVVLLHGFPEGYLSFRGQIGPLAAAGCRVVAPDQRGYNLTDKTGPYDLDTLAADVVHLLDACGAERAHVAGHDWGGAVAWWLAERHPERLMRFAALNAPHPNVGVRSIWRGNLRQLARSAYMFFLAAPGLAERALRRNDFALLRQSLRRSSTPGAFPEAVLDAYAQGWRRPGALTAMLGWYRAFLGAQLRRLGRLPRLRRIETPGLIIWGERDAALGVELAEQSAALLTRGRLERLPDATHWVQADRPGEVARRLREWFGEGS
jgi:pimeloyl-ACP methyl ester carboxylesterase